MNIKSSYNKDFHAWALRNAELIRQGRLADIDAEHIAEELEDMGKSEARRLESHLTVLIAHLLKWQAQPERRGKSWENTIKEQRRQVEKVLRQNPSLKARLDDIYYDAYENAIYQAYAETGIDDQIFRELPPFSYENAMNPEFFE